MSMKTKIAAISLAAASVAGIGSTALASNASASGAEYIHYAVAGGYSSLAECQRYDHGVRHDIAAGPGVVNISMNQGCKRLRSGRYTYGWTDYISFTGKPLVAGDKLRHGALPPQQY